MIYKYFLLIISVCISFHILLSELQAQEKLLLDCSVGYSQPMLEAYGTNVVFVNTDLITIDGKTLLTSDNLGTDIGVTINLNLKYNFFKRGYLKGLFNVGFVQLLSRYQGPESNYGVRIQSFSFGPGLEFTPIGYMRFHPSLFGKLRVNFIGGETYYHTGRDALVVTPRFGYSAGFNLNYKISRKIGTFAGWSYNYDNAWGKREANQSPTDEFAIPFRDKVSATNGLTHDRRIVYTSYYFGLIFYLK